MPRSGPKDFGFLTKRPFAHRGLHAPGGPVENTLAAFDRAIAAGHGIELDVRLTSDKEVVVFHDADLKRLTGNDRRIEDVTAAELVRVRIGSSGEPIRTLRDVLTHIGGRVPVLIEAKSPGQAGVYGMCRAIRHALEGAHGWTAVMSFNPRIVRWFRDHSQMTVRGLIITEEPGSKTPRGVRGWIGRSMALRHCKPHFAAYDIRSLPCRSAEQFRRTSQPVLTWTVRSADDRARAAMYADQIIYEETGAS